MTDRFKFRAYFNNLSLDEVEEGLKKSFYLYDVSIYSNNSGVGIEESELEYQLAEQGFTQKEIDYMSWTYGNGDGWVFIDEECCREQCTDLKDKNGTLIYCGDTLFGREEGNGETTAWTDVYKTVFWHKEYGRWCVKDKDGNEDWWDDLYDYIDYYEIIGNIYQNKELLDV